MSVRIRLARAGRKKIPHYRIVVMDSRNRRDGAYIEKIGLYDPRRQPPQIEVAEDRALHWLSQGAVPSETVRSLLSKHGIMLRFDLMKRNTPSERVDETVSQWKEQASAREARRAQQKSQRRKKKETAQPEAVPEEPIPSA